MESYYLNRGEYFTSEKDILCIDNTNEVYYVEDTNGRYIAWNRNNDTYSILMDGKPCMVNQLNFYSVIDGSLVFVQNEVYDLTTGNLLSKNDEVIIEKLNKLLNIKGNQKYLFTLEDVHNFLGDEKTKLKTKKRK